MPEEITPQKLDLPEGHVFIVLTPDGAGGNMVQVYNNVETEYFHTVAFARGIVEYACINPNDILARGYRAIHADIAEMDGDDTEGDAEPANDNEPEQKEFDLLTSKTPTVGNA